MTKIKEYRIKTGLTQEDMGDMLNIPLSTIKKWECGDRTCPSYVEEFILEKLQKLIEKNNPTLLSVIKNAYKLYIDTGTNLSIFIFPHYEAGTWRKNMPLKLILAEFNPYDKRSSPLAFNDYGSGKTPIYRVTSSNYIKDLMNDAMHSIKLDRIKELNSGEEPSLFDDKDMECDYTREELEKSSWDSVENEILKRIGTAVIEWICPSENIDIPEKIQIHNNENQIIYPFNNIITL